ncbi:MAG: isopenicillin N synthase family oxygenase [Bdellovibrionaceae bacterium]|nr:isopenicillin N synthase family oxygenase [Pseudobdellovibrionaceae bacterium]
MKTLECVPELRLKDYTKGDDQQRQQFIEDLFLGLKYFGFIILKDHSIPVEILKRAYSLSEVLFNLSESQKLKYTAKIGGGQRGYTPFGKEHAKDAKVMDLKEFWHIGQELEAGNKYETMYPPNLWPTEVDDFKETFLQIYNELENAGKVILEALTYSLKVDKDYFASMVKDGNSILRLLHYPPIPADADPRCIRAAAHEDINLITILVAASTSGLELLDRNAKWLPVETDANNLIVDAGDMLARITNDVIPATTHRVVNPDDKNSHRYSMPFFMHPHPEAVLSCIDSCKGKAPKYPEITSHDFLMQRLREIGLM